MHSLDSQDSILEKIKPEYSLESRIMKHKLSFSGHIVWDEAFVEKMIILGKMDRKKKKPWLHEAAISTTGSYILYFLCSA